MLADSRSLNLSNTAAVIVYEAWRQLNAFPPALQDRDGASKGTGAKDASGKGTEGKVL